jgi:hypothetical protein
MGYEAKCRVRVDDRAGNVREADGTVLIETDEVIVRGEARVRVPRTSIERVTSRGGTVTITSPAAIVSLTLPADAAAKLKTRLEAPPKALIDKLDVKPGARVWVRDVDDDVLLTQLEERTPNVIRAARGGPGASCDVVFVGVSSEKELDRIDRVVPAMRDAGAIWVVHPRGPGGVADTAIYARAKILGLTATKVARISATLTGEKLVRPLAARRRSVAG